MGHQVFGVGDNRDEVECLNAAKPLVHEPKLQAIMRRNLRAGRLRYTTNYTQALQGAEFTFIAIDTPVGLDDESDLTPIWHAAHQVSKAVTGDLILCISAQVPVGTCEQIASIVQEEICKFPTSNLQPPTSNLQSHKGTASLSPISNPPSAIQVAYVPEFLRLGTAVDNFRHPDRVVIGAQNREVAEKIARLYQPLKRPILITDIRTAEMAKHAANAFLATSISFINEIANLCEAVDADALEVSKILKLDQRIGPHAFLSPGLGFAGGTLGREIRALQKIGRGTRTPMPLMDAVWQVNAARPQLVSRRLSEVFGSLVGQHIGILGLTYKPGTSTLRRAISLDIIRELVGQGAHVSAFDPLANLDELGERPPMRFFRDPYAVAEGSSALVLITEWADYKSLDLPRLRARMRGDVLLDTRNLLDPVRVAEAGFRYLGIGR